MNPFKIAALGKGPLGMLKRARVISSRYGLSSAKMDRILTQFTRILDQFNCGATFPITGASLARNKKIIEKYKTRNIEFAVHGYFHIDHTRLTLPEQLRHLEKARHVFNQMGIVGSGFRSPYLRWSEATLNAVNQSGFLYESSQALAWDEIDGFETETYRRVLSFYGAILSRDYPSLPRLENGLVRIPYCLPDDEAFIDRLKLTTDHMSRLWLAILAKTYEEGELFTLGLHPERFNLCEKSLVDTLCQARGLIPSVWIARLDEVATWWKARAEATVIITEGHGDQLSICISGPKNMDILARGVNVLASTMPWDLHYQRVLATEFSFLADRRPFIGISRSSSDHLKNFLRQQGFIVESADNDQIHTFFIDDPAFDCQNERTLLAQIEQSDIPLIRLGRWPNHARSALCITGDIDALTLWDYGLRFFER